jgi:hypothetical protein
MLKFSRLQTEIGDFHEQLGLSMIRLEISAISSRPQLSTLDLYSCCPISRQALFQKWTAKGTENGNLNDLGLKS